MKQLTPVLIALGSNINRERNLPQAITILESELQIRLRAISSIYETLPVGGHAFQPPFFNAAALIETSLEPAELKRTLLSIERRLGRVRSEDKYAPRPIDLDIALYGQEVFELNSRHIPDPDVTRFPHVLLPLVDVAPDWIHPERGITLQEIAAGLEFSEKEIRKI